MLTGEKLKELGHDTIQSYWNAITEFYNDKNTIIAEKMIMEMSTQQREEFMEYLIHNNAVLYRSHNEFLLFIIKI